MLGIAVVVAALMPANVNADDQQIADFVKSRLQTEQQRGNLRGFNVDMRVDKGTVWFKGFVANRDQELLILRTAQTAGHLGVVQVVDDIELNTAGPQPNSMPAPMPSPMAQAPMPQPQRAPMPAPNFQMEEDLQTSQVGYQEPLLRANPLAAAGMQSRQPTPPFGSPIAQQPISNWQQAASTYAPPTQPRGMIQPRMPMTGMGAQMPVSQQPLAFASAKSPAACVGQDCYAGDAYGYGSPISGGYESYGYGTPVAEGSYGGGGGGGGAGSYGGSPNLPGYAWPGYAAASNYAGVSYPQQYSPAAWPYIGPFYPYPQVPLGWRKVSLEWDDGWWFLDFNDKSQ